MHKTRNASTSVLFLTFLRKSGIEVFDKTVSFYHVVQINFTGNSIFLYRSRNRTVV